jgi:hypothetical protein
MICSKNKCACSTAYYHRKCRCNDCIVWNSQTEYRRRLKKQNKTVAQISDKLSSDLISNFREWLKEQLPCKNCKQWFNQQCMELDHTVAVRGVRVRPSRLTVFITELVKTRVLCANCHSIRTHQQRQKWNLEEAA